MAVAADASLIAKAKVALEYTALRNANHCPAGVYIWPSPQSALVWDCVFFVHQGYYNNAVLKLRLMFPATYPAAPPAVHFATDVFHPLVSQRDGLFSLSPRFSDWSPSRHHVYDVLHFIKASFKKDTLKLKDTDCFNKEALRLYRENTSSFAALAAQSATLSQSKSALFDRDHPTLVGKGRDSVIFKETAPDALAKMRASLGLEEWTLGNFE